MRGIKVSNREAVMVKKYSYKV